MKDHLKMIHGKCRKRSPEMKFGYSSFRTGLFSQSDRFWIRTCIRRPSCSAVSSALTSAQSI